jgi:hypothetical protein
MSVNVPPMSHPIWKLLMRSLLWVYRPNGTTFRTHRVDIPPSTGTIAPVMKDAAGEVR